ncbi:MAG TPA: hypothetical protein VFK33_07855 [Bacillales bacterium]|nr:hypothetical protein [Bacillales bacterium]
MRLLRCLAVFLIGLAILFPAGQSVWAQSPKLDYYVDQSKLPFDALPGTHTSRYWGVHNGAGYRIEVPKHWNGELVLYAHGYRGTGLELTVSNPPFRKYLVTHGFAWAASSYRANGYNVKAGVKDTHALGKLFNGKVHKPKRTYVTGESMGGHIVGVLIEQYPNAYAGALPMCGVMGDYELFDFFGSYNLIAQDLAGVKSQFPANVDYQTKTVAKMQDALGFNTPTGLNEKGKKLRAATMYMSGGKRPLFNIGFRYWKNFLFTLYEPDPTLGVTPGNFISNNDTVYQLDSDPALSPTEKKLNQTVLRVDADPQGRHPNGLSNIPPISGDIDIPVLSMHTLGDLFVPFSMEEIYAQRVADHGKSNLLVTRAIRDIHHCGFTYKEQTTAFSDLVNWVENGVKPAGSNVLSPKAVADPTFGLQFTSQLRPYDPLRKSAAQ